MGIIKIECPSCNQHYSADVSFIGQKVECSVCGNSFTLGTKNVISGNAEHQETHFTQKQQPTQKTTSNPKILCPFCKQSYEVEPDVIGKKVQCSVCNETFVAHRNRPRQPIEQVPQWTRTSTEQQPYRPDQAQQASSTQERYILPPQGQMQSAYGIPQNQRGQQLYSNKNNDIFSFKRVLFGVLIVIGSCFLLAVWTCNKKDGSFGSSSSHIETNKQYHMTSGAVGFASKDSLEKYHKYYQQNDTSARMSYLMLNMASGDAVMFSGGETVIVSDISSWSRMAKVRRPGSFSEYWVYTVWLE